MRRKTAFSRSAVGMAMDPHGYGYGVGMGIEIPSPRQPWRFLKVNHERQYRSIASHIKVAHYGAATAAKSDAIIA